LLLVSHDRALLDAVAQRTLAVEDGTVREYDGGWADYVRRREERAAAEAAAAEQPAPPAPKPKPAARRPARPTPKRPTELERLEADIAAREAEIADLERRLADDWSDVDAIAAHRRKRDELGVLLERWEAAFEQA
jgi:ATPase subunit of ABC transporter with duplicated ATPase domains